MLRSCRSRSIVLQISSKCSRSISPSQAIAPSNCAGTRESRSPARGLSSSTFHRKDEGFRAAVDITKHKHFDPLPALNSAGQIPTAPYDISPLACSAPSYPKGHLIVHPFSQPRPQETWPPAIQSVCPLVNELEGRKSQLQGWGISFSDGDPRLTGGKESRFDVWDPATSKVARPDKGDAQESEEFLISVYEGNGRHAVVGPYSVKTIPEDLTLAIDAALQTAPQPSARFRSKEEEAHVYVCTHGSRDCRCGVVGEELKSALREEARKHEVRTLGEGSKKVKVFGISHIGGHKWAANALIYPHGDWYGNLRVTDSSLILRSALAPSTSRHDLTDQRERLVHWPRWRGRLGADEEKMRKLWDEWGGGMVETAVITPAVRRRSPQSAAATPPTASASSVLTESAATPSVATPPSEPLSIPFRKHTGEVILVPCQLGETLKDVAQRGSISEIEATCGGKCECATCHAYIAPPSTPSAPSIGGAESGNVAAFAGDTDLNSLPIEGIIAEATDEEMDMLDYAISRKASSRLLCQVKVTPELCEWMREKGGRVQLAKY